MLSVKELQNTSSQIRRDILRMVSAAGSGHPGGSLSSADILTALYFNVMEHDPASWTRSATDKDAFMLSAGHLAPVYYAVLARAGYFPVAELGTLRRFGSRLQGHPSVVDSLPGVHRASGSLGQGLAAAAGMALGKKMDGDTHTVYALCGDGESEEGEIWETAMFAAHHGLDNLVAMTDCNHQQIDGRVEDVAGLENLSERWLAFGWDVICADGHDFESILDAFKLAQNRNGKPKMILFETIMGKGVDFMEGTHEWHGKAPNAELLARALPQLEETLGDY